ncbi:MAG: ATP-grasp domain-containing protein, partial [Deltaproteobacteria bacterium]|nr:ATP-grasp domain-containing protein [Deltaproteobacteria bacterium]
MPKIQKILIANRGEIALRILRACRDLNIKTVSIYSEADSKALHVLQAEEAYCVGPASVAQSYLNTDKIISIALQAKADAIHPGYGFLSENPEFAEKVQKAGLIFIGPSAEIIRAMGCKIEARKIAQAAQVPIVPGIESPLQNFAEAEKMAEAIGYPILLKASAGGGGKGMRTVRQPKDLKSAFDLASAEALSAFGNKSLYLEKLIENPHHIEIQVFGDSHGNILHLYERECSIQRRHQKVIEESPSPFITQKTREALCDVSIKLCRALGYTNAGTLEFLVDADQNFYFLEMNTRLQVEHPITEQVTGIDCVKLQ